MSQVKISGNASGTGVLTIAAPNTNTDRTLDLPDSAGTVATAESTLAQFNASGSAPVFACRAWVNFNGTGTVAIRDSGNVSSITDNGTGNYTINFTTSIEDANYCAVGSASGTATAGQTYVVGMYSATATGSQQVAVCRNDENVSTPTDRDAVLVAIFR